MERRYTAPWRQCIGGEEVVPLPAEYVHREAGNSKKKVAAGNTMT